ncbi:MAG TPA: TonB-dependent siderophore receptor [Geminicoccus sp.]|jgi:catecholate siderophore receptor|uniref:TonB-dependent receptor n=1 Tax=Geminicoccus sp. TaxID=2024832 RepID=UPI002E31E340|nr:TonB-dependent siderophore receptor [Geminicoccus sp.]HEX2525428.1 TonB-dependent siderophore receptor [Geminicoccus sp.]
MDRNHELDWPSLHSAIATAGMTALALSTPGDVAAQEASAGPADAGDAVVLPPVSVEADAQPANTLRSATGIGRLPGTVQDTPQTIQVITGEVMQQQAVTSLDQALRNVPGVTVSSGEGNGGLNGDQFRIRGFDAKGDVYLDGLRDFGVYVRDSFNYEQVDVLLGPSSETFGFGSTGGVVNTQSKTAHLGNAASIDGLLGTGPLYRVVGDVNQQINETTAVRVVGMYHDQDVADRDHVENDRWGIAGSLAFGLGTDLNWSLNYLHQHGDRTPDYGVPSVVPPGSEIGRPVTEYGVSRDSFYGKKQDEEVSDVDMLTSRLAWQLTDSITLNNDTRLAYYTREFSTTPVVCDADCSAEFFAGGNPTLGFSGGGNPAFNQQSWGFQNVTSGVFDFTLAGFRNQAVAGVDIFYQNDQRDGRSVDGEKTAPTIRNPGDFFGVDDYMLPVNPNNIKKSYGTDIGLFASDRFWFTDAFSVLAGVRWDDYSSTYKVFSNDGYNKYEADNSFWSPKGSLIWEPTRDQTYYFSYATSSTVPGQYATSAPNPINGQQPDLEPEENEIFELGGKISMLGGQLGLTGSVFRIEKDNAYYTDPTTELSTATGEKQRVQGFTLGASGLITEAWSASVAYAYLDTKIQSSTAAVSTVGNEVPNAPENAFTLWTTYDVLSHFPAVPGDLTVGGGVTYRDEMFTSSANTAQLPESFTLDAVVSYRYEHYRLALNGYNLTDELNYGQAFNARAVPDSGRTFLLSVGATF